MTIDALYVHNCQDPYDLVEALIMLNGQSSYRSAVNGRYLSHAALRDRIRELTKRVGQPVIVKRDGRWQLTGVGLELAGELAMQRIKERRSELAGEMNK